jgi:copper(I)-binding protein
MAGAGFCPALPEKYRRSRRLRDQLELTMAAALAIGLASAGSAHQEVAGNLKIGHPWIREAAAGAPSTYACIIEIKNEGDEPETLLGATVDGAWRRRSSRGGSG